jgi:hypothetical protein
MANKIYDSLQILGNGTDPILSLKGSDNNVKISIGDTGIIRDSSTNPTIDPNIRRLYDSSGSTISIDWQNRVTRDTLGNISINWSTGILARFGVLSLDWNNRKLIGTGGTGDYAIDWSTRQLVGSDANTVTLDWSNISGPTSITQSPGDNSTKLATTAYVDDAISSVDFPDITIDYIPMGTGTSITDGTWYFSGNDIVPTVDGSNIGSDASPDQRIGTIYMASNIDYSSNLLFKASGTEKMRITTSGRLSIDTTTPRGKLSIVSNGANNLNDYLVYFGTSDAVSGASAVTYGQNGGYGYGWKNYVGSSSGTGTVFYWSSYNETTGNFLNENVLTLQNKKVNINGLNGGGTLSIFGEGNTSATYALKIENSISAGISFARDDRSFLIGGSGVDIAYPIIGSLTAGLNVQSSHGYYSFIGNTSGKGFITGTTTESGNSYIGAVDAGNAINNATIAFKATNGHIAYGFSSLEHNDDKHNFWLNVNADKFSINNYDARTAGQGSTIYFRTRSENGSNLYPTVAGISGLSHESAGAGTNFGFLTFYTQGSSFAERMRIDKDGNVGIGTITPTSQLHVDTSMQLGAGTPIGKFSIFKPLSQIPIWIEGDNAGTTVTNDAAILIYNSDSTDNNYATLNFQSKITGGARDSGNPLVIGALFSQHAGSVRPNFIVNISGSEKMRVQYDGNVGIGTAVPSAKLHVKGFSPDTTSSTAFMIDNFASDNLLRVYNSGQISAGLSTGNNLFVGVGSGLNIAGAVENAAFGWHAGFALTTGSTNALFGRIAGAGLTTGGGNSIFGGQAGAAMTTGTANSIVGYNSMQQGTGSYNSYLGYSVGFYTTGSLNIAMGQAPFSSSSFSGSANIGLGQNVGRSLTTGYQNVFIGGESGENIYTGNRNIFLGDNAGIWEGYDTPSSSDKLIIDGQRRFGNTPYVGIESDSRTMYLIYGNHSQYRVNQNILINAATRINGTFKVAGNATEQDSGLLIVGNTYTIRSYGTIGSPDDDFTNVGAGSNAAGVTFVATGTTPAVWTNSSVLLNETISFQITGANKIKYVDGNQASGKVLTSDADGLATWSSIGAISGTATGTGTTDYIVKWTDGPGSEIGDGTWYFSGNDLVPTVDGSNIGSDASPDQRIGTIYMASNIDYLSTLNFKVNGTSKANFNSSGQLTLGFNSGIGTEGKLFLQSDTYIGSITQSGNDSMKFDTVGSYFQFNKKLSLSIGQIESETTTLLLRVGGDRPAMIMTQDGVEYKGNTKMYWKTSINTDPFSSTMFSIKGEGNTSGTTPLSIKNSDNNNVFVVNDVARATLGATANKGHLTINSDYFEGLSILSPYGEVNFNNGGGISRIRGASGNLLFLSGVVGNNYQFVSAHTDLGSVTVYPESSLLLRHFQITNAGNPLRNSINLDFSSQYWNGSFEVSNTYTSLRQVAIDTSGDYRLALISNGVETISVFKSGQLRYTYGTPGSGKVLTSDATGLATWTSAGSLPGVGTVNKYAETLSYSPFIPADTPITITHSLGTTDIIVQLWDLSDGTAITAKLDNRTSSTVDVTFEGDSPAGDVRIIILA